MAYGPWGNEANASCSFTGTWICDPDNPAGTVIRLRYGGLGRQKSQDRAKTALQFVGRTYPVYDTGGARAESINVDAVLSSEDGDSQQQLELLERLIGDGEVVLYRDGRGRKMYAVGTDFQSEDLECQSYNVKFLLNRVDYDEALPEPTAAPPVVLDTQPKNLTASADQTTRMAFLEWDDVPGTTLYHVFLNGNEVGSTSESATTYGPLDPGEYTFRVTATVGGANSPASAQVGVTILPANSGGVGTTVPQNFRALPGTTSVTLQWDPVTGATEYLPFETRSPNGVSGGSTTSTSQTRTGLAAGPFEYWVKAKVNGVWSAESNHQAFTLPYTGGGGTGTPTTMPSPAEVLGIKNGDAGYLHYNLGCGFTDSKGHKDYTVQQLEDWSSADAAELANNYFTVIDAAGKYAVVMTVDPAAATTSTNTHYPRCEHREMAQTDTNNANKGGWDPSSGDHDFSGFTRIMTLPPAKPGVCIDQYHDQKDDTVMILTLSLSGKTAVALNVNGTRVKVLNADYKLGTEIYHRMRVNNGTLTIYYGESSSSTTSAAVSTSVNYTHPTALTNTNPPWYQKFGCYAQSNATTDTSGTKCRVQVRDFKQWHTGWPTPVTGNYAGPPSGGGSGGLPSVSAGGDATIAPGATFSRTAQVTGSSITSQGWRLVGSGGSSTDQTTAAGKLGWGVPDALSDEFEYSGAPDPNKWNVYNSAGHAGNGVRNPARASVGGGKLTLTGLAGNANTAGMEHKLSRQYGKWEWRSKSYYTGDPTAPGNKDGGYHPVALIWPQDDSTWPNGGEYDAMENGEPGMQQAEAWLHYPSLDGSDHQIEVPAYAVDMRQMHNYAIEWTSSFIKLYVDGNLWYTAQGGAASDRKAIQAMAIGALTFQLDAFQATGCIGSAMEIEWMRTYPLVPVTSNAQLSSTINLNWTAPTTPGTYTLEAFATNATGTTTDQVVVTVGTPTGGGGSLVYPEQFPDGTPFSTFGAAQNVINVSGSAALTSALAAAAPGQIITLASGTYSGDFVIAKRGTAAQAIIIRAATRLGPVFSTGSSFKINDASYVTVDGLDFPNDDEGDTLQIRGASDHVQYRRCRVGPSTFVNKTTVGNFVYVGDDVHDFRIGYCTLRNKGTSGNGIRVYGNFTTFVGCKNGLIDHNLIDTIGDEVGNDKEAIRYGVSTMSRTIANAVIMRNVITNAKAEPELISGKMASVWQIGNVALKCAGGFVIRHGRNCKQMSNYMVDRVATTATAGLKSGGSRFYDSGHIIEDNYYDGLAGVSGFQKPLMLDTGDAAPDSTALDSHFNLVNCAVQRNVIVNCPSGINIGDNYTTPPANCSVTDNDVINSGGAAVTTVLAMTGDSPVTNNQYFASTGAGGYTADAQGIYRKAGRGPKVKYLLTTDVGVTGDLDELDKTGAAV